MPTRVPAERAWMLPDEPLPVRLMSTIWGDAVSIHDDLGATADLDQWLDAVGVARAGAHATESELALARALRDAVRRLAAYVTGDGRPRAASAVADITAAVGQVNSVAARLPARSLALRDGRLELGSPAEPSPVTTGLARVAAAAIGLFTGADAARLRACTAPNCVQYFVKTHPRRQWCTVACGNRVRAARHYERTRKHGD
jgi:predicted RNA-binding Zn ribbon-like protein